MSPRLWRDRARRGGYSLVEILIALVILSVIGGALVTMLTNQSRFFQKTQAMQQARSVTRSAANVMFSDMRMVQDVGGVQSGTSANQVVLRVPYMFGVVCATVGASTTVWMFPTDSMSLVLSKHAGHAVRDSATREYSYTASTLPMAGSEATCTAAGVNTPSVTKPNGATVQGPVYVITPAIDHPIGTPVFFYQNVTYRFGQSEVFPGRRALWRIRTGTDSLEVMAPFGEGARFRFYTYGNTTPQDAVPSDPDDVSGFELVLTGASQYVPPTQAAADSVPLRTAVFFMNRVWQ
jgi:prepilin-type N-terminal cleavage/methylation domain-containing protein